MPPAGQSGLQGLLAVARVLTFAVDVQVGPVVPEHGLHQLCYSRRWGRESGCEPRAVWTRPRSPQSWPYNRARADLFRVPAL